MDQDQMFLRQVADEPYAILHGRYHPEFLRDETLPEIFAASATRHAGRIALRDRNHALTYAEVNGRAGAMARGLMARGIGVGDVVGLWLCRGIELLIAQIAITRTGAAWLPFDADAPMARIDECLIDANAKGLVTTRSFTGMFCQDGARIWHPIRLADTGASGETAARPAGLTPDHAAYIIYTSGSTGTPKGITISHRNICHYLRAANEVYGLHRDDVVFQGASVAFDLSLEEIWIPYLVGATLFVATSETMSETDRLGEIMAAQGVTVLDTVPTLLALIGDVPSLRLIILGGEACPAPLVNRWSRPGRRIFNSYGPTEATVVATVAEVHPDQPVTIGRPIPNYSCYIVDEALSLVAPGAQGELLIGGPGVAPGYLRRAELTAAKFIANPFGSDGGDPILYRSGDAVSLDENGNILFHGRIDDQVKIRGLRVELGEIEAALCDLPGIAQAAVVMRQDGGIDKLVAFLVRTPGQERIENAALQAPLRARLPAYMVPSWFEFVEELPRLISGKTDRRTLQAMPLAPRPAFGLQEDAQSPTEQALLDAAKVVFPNQTIGFEADFFTDLGGHSLLAAKFVSGLRTQAAYAGITLQDLYRERTLRALGQMLDARQPAAAGSEPPRRTFTPPPLLRRFLCGLAQAAALPIIVGLTTAQWLGIFAGYLLFEELDASLLQQIAGMIGVYLVINLFCTLFPIAAKWLILGRTKPGRYPLWGAYYFRWWFVRRLTAIAHLKRFQFSPMKVLYLRAMGASVGRDAMIGEMECGAMDLMTIGARSTLGSRVTIANARVVGHELIIAPVTIGEDVQIGNSVVIEGGAMIGTGAEVADLTAIHADTQVGAWERWDGSPARRSGVVNPDSLPAQADAGPIRRGLHMLVYAAALIALPPIGLLPLIPAFMVFDKADELFAGGLPGNATVSTFLLAMPTAAALTLVTVLFIVAIRWTILPRVRPGSYSIHSNFYLRKWIVTLASEITLDTLHSLYATVYMRSWYRLMGAKIGKGTEVSTSLAGRYELIELGEKCFIADEAMVGDEEIRRGWMALARVRTGDRVFIGNSAVVPGGAEIGNGSLVGVKSKPPMDRPVGVNETWFGSPPIRFPVRQTFGEIGQIWTFEPPAWRKWARAGFEAITISLPTALYITFGMIAIDLLTPSLLARDVAAALPLFMALSMAISIAMLVIVVGVKWGLMGVYKPMMKPMWSWWAMRTEAIAVMYWSIAGKALLDQARGTPFLPWMLRLFGCRIGKGVYLDMSDLTEFDCVRIGDYSAVEAVSCLQTHLYEDRLMKVGRIEIGSRVSIGAGSTVLYDTAICDDVELGPLTLLMKGETIPAGQHWSGAPAEPMQAIPAARAVAA